VPGYRAEFLDLRPEYGAAASMVTEYLRASCESQVDALVATALLHGIKTDTDLLTRGVSPDDVQAYAFVQERSDPALLRRFERPSFSVPAARCYGAAVSGVSARSGIAAAHAGEVPEGAAYLLPELADFCLVLADTRVAVASGYVGEELVLTFRYGGRDGVDAGELARRAAAGGGQGGGHASMARASLPRALAAERLQLRADTPVAERLVDYVRELAEAAGFGEALTRRS
jgi:nanoRNase/pAp phosphatase (c-di-AMP/oligoRNAs hydrolase)